MLLDFAVRVKWPTNVTCCPVGSCYKVWNLWHLVFVGLIFFISFINMTFVTGEVLAQILMSWSSVTLVLATQVEICQKLKSFVSVTEVIPIIHLYT